MRDNAFAVADGTSGTGGALLYELQQQQQQPSSAPSISPEVVKAALAEVVRQEQADAKRAAAIDQAPGAMATMEIGVQFDRRRMATKGLQRWVRVV